MSKPDFNLLVTLDVLLAEESVTRSAERLRLSPSAMSRSLARLRKTVGDPLLVRAGRGLVPTPRAIELRGRVHQIVQDSEAALRPAAGLDLTQLVKTYTLRASDGFVENFGPDLITRLGTQAPGVRLRFLQKTDKNSLLLREGLVDLEIGVVGGTASPELRVQRLFRDRFVAVVRMEHPLVRRKVTLADYVGGKHILVSRRGRDAGPIDEALKRLGSEREITTIVGGYSSALALARNSDLIASIPERQTANLRNEMHSFPLPVKIPKITISMQWHPRMEADPAQIWLRGCVRHVCSAHAADI